MNNIKDIKLFIPTKNRLNNEKTYNILKSIGLNPYIVIEPQEEDKAKELNFNYILLPENNKGISFARNFILNYARKNKYEYICILDDDISKMGYIEKNENVKNKLKQGRNYDNRAFIDALKIFMEYKTCGTMQYTQFAWNQIKPIVYNRGIEVIWFLYMPLLKDIIIEEDTIEDRDFSLDIILNHNIKTFRLNHHFFCVPTIGTNSGGIESNTRELKQKYWAEKMQKKWGKDIIDIITKSNGYINIKINWKNVDKLINLQNNTNEIKQLTIYDAIDSLQNNTNVV